jgi:AraC-like DNA-binding protein
MTQDSFVNIASIPEVYIAEGADVPELMVYDLHMQSAIVKDKVQLSRHMFSFLQRGTKQVHLSTKSFQVDASQSLMLKQGHCLWSETLDAEATYYCKLLFFSDVALRRVLQEYGGVSATISARSSFIIENDAYIDAFVVSLGQVPALKRFQERFLSLKFEELLLYLLEKYGTPFEAYLAGLLSSVQNQDVAAVVQANTYSSLSVEELAFLSNRSLSTFKRQFKQLYKESPGKWLRNKRLDHAKFLLHSGQEPLAEVYWKLGYTSLSNFSSAFKTKFGVSPSKIARS